MKNLASQTTFVVYSGQPQGTELTITRPSNGAGDSKTNTYLINPAAQGRVPRGHDVIFKNHSPDTDTILVFFEVKASAKSAKAKLDAQRAELDKMRKERDAAIVERDAAIDERDEACRDLEQQQKENYEMRVKAAGLSPGSKGEGAGAGSAPGADAGAGR